MKKTIEEINATMKELAEYTAMKEELTAQIEALQAPNDDCSYKDHGKGSVEEILCLFPEQPYDIIRAGHTVIGQLHDKGNRFPLEQESFI